MLSWLVLTSVNSNIQWTFKWLYSYLNKPCPVKLTHEKVNELQSRSCMRPRKMKPFFASPYMLRRDWQALSQGFPQTIPCPTLFASLESLSQWHFSNLSTSSINTKPSHSYTVTCTRTHCSGYTFTCTQLVYTLRYFHCTHIWGHWWLQGGLGKVRNAAFHIVFWEVLTAHYHIWPLVQLNFRTTQSL